MNSRVAVGLALLSVVLLLVIGLAPPVAGAAGGLTFRVSVNSQGEPADNNSFEADISADGRYVAFRSGASNLDDPPVGGYGARIYVRDNDTGHVAPAMVTYTGETPLYGGESPAISGDGRYVAFRSNDPSLLPESTYYTYRIYVRDMAAGATVMASVSSGEEPAWADAGAPDISADGRFVVFASEASNLAPDDNEYSSDVFLRDLQTGVTTRVSSAPDGTVGDGPSGNPRISANGNVIVYSSTATNLTPGDTNGEFDIFIYDRTAGQTTRVAIAAHSDLGIPGVPTISGNGRYVAFSTGLGALTGEEDGARWDVFVYDRQGGTIERVSLDSEGNAPPVGEHTYLPEISDDGRYVSFVSDAPLTPDATSDLWPYAYLRDRVAGTTELISVGPEGAISVETYPAAPSPLSGDGRFVVFRSSFPGVVGDESAEDVFVRDRAPAATSFAVTGMVVGPDGSPLAGVVVSDGQGHEATSGADGAFAFAGLPSGTYRLTPQKAGYGFTPAGDTVTVPPAAGSATFVAREAFDITGRVVYEDGSGFSGAAVILSDGQATSTDADGYYRFEDVAPGDYTLTPASEYYDFTPAQRDVTVGPDATVPDFTARPKRSSISGTVRDQDGAPLPDVAVELSGHDISTLTDENGFYQFTDLTAYQVAVRPTLAGYRFDPEYQVVLDRPGDAAGVDFVGSSLAVEVVYVSPAHAGKVKDLQFHANDILAYDVGSRTWSLYFDGSDVGLRRNVNNFAFREDGTILLTLDQLQNVPGVGPVTANDVLSFTPSSLGPNTAGTLAFHFDGSDVGLSTPAERLDALGAHWSGMLLSTRGRANVTTFDQPIVARDDDIILFQFTSPPGAATDGAFQLYRSFLQLPDMTAENLVGLSLDPMLDDLYVSFATQFNIGGVKGRPGTVVRLVADPFGVYTPEWFWDAQAAGLAAPIDGMEVGR